MVVISVLVGDLILLYTQLQTMQMEVGNFKQNLDSVRLENQQVEERMELGKVGIGILCLLGTIAIVIYFSGMSPEDAIKLFKASIEHRTMTENSTLSSIKSVGDQIINTLTTDMKTTNEGLNSLDKVVKEGLEVISKQIQALGNGKSSISNVFEGSSEPKFK